MHGPTSVFYNCITTGMHGPTCIFWTNLTPFSLKPKSLLRLLGGTAAEGAVPLLLAARDGCFSRGL